MSAPVGDACPGCGRAAAMRVGDEQYFCEGGDCHVVMWNPKMTLAELAADVTTIDIPDLGEGP